MKEIEKLAHQLCQASSVHERLAFLDQFEGVREFFERRKVFRAFLAGISPDCESVLKQMIAIGQAEELLRGVDEEHLEADLLRDLIAKLIPIDNFYRELGGIVGYQAKILRLLSDRGGKDQSLPGQLTYRSPHFHDIGEETEAVEEAIRWGIEALPLLAEMYPLGGAADRLHLICEKTGEELPAAKLPFAGKPLFEHLIRDLQAREYLYFKIHGRQLTTPIAIMTSLEKENHSHVLQICSDCQWFGRPKDSFRFFTQPLVPTVDEKGDWCLLSPLRPLLKPGGHGAIWKLAEDEGVFSWLQKLGRKKAIIRQINNPLASLDYGLLAFSGIGCKAEMVFGFASCPRLLQAAEGVNVLIERKGEQGTEVVLSNIEYCDFTKFGIEDLPLKEGEPYSRFSSNTNILFADLGAMRQAVRSCPYPGLLINLKRALFTTGKGEKKEGNCARLESTMQNIADVFVERKEEGESLTTQRTFVTYNRRYKTISTAKKAFIPGRTLQETPENCFFDLLYSAHELLQECGFSLPPARTIETYLQEGPSFVFLYHPALGPLYSLIRQKLRGGQISLGSELLLEVAEASIENLTLKGSLQIIAEQVLGPVDEGGILRYSNQVGRCLLENVTVENRGVDWAASTPFWKMDLKRHERVKVLLKGRSIFRAHNVHLIGSHEFVVEEGVEMEVRQIDNQLVIEKRPLSAQNLFEALENV